VPGPLPLGVNARVCYFMTSAIAGSSLPMLPHNVRSIWSDHRRLEWSDRLAQQNKLSCRTDRECNAPSRTRLDLAGSRAVRHPEEDSWPCHRDARNNPPAPAEAVAHEQARWPSSRGLL